MPSGSAAKWHLGRAAWDSFPSYTCKVHGSTLGPCVIRQLNKDLAALRLQLFIYLMHAQDAELRYAFMLHEALCLATAHRNGIDLGK